MEKARVLIDCKDKKGLVYKTSKVFYENNLNILSNQEFVDEDSKHFFMRSVVEGEFKKEALEKELIETLGDDANIKVIEPSKKNIVLMATKESHALGDILIRYCDGELDANILAVIANRDNLKRLAERFNIPFIHISAENISREEPALVGG